MKTVPLLSLKPTQFALGMAQISEKIEEIKKMSKSERKKYLKKKPVKVIKGHEGHFYIIDHHHEVMALWAAGIHKVKLAIKADISKRSFGFKSFWKFMQKKRWCHLCDQFGEGQRSPLYLPMDIRGMADDPYRSLAWAVREGGGFKNTEEPFCEFKWADFFRKRRLLHDEGRSGFDRAVKKGIKLAKSRAAQRLPGYIGQSSDK